MRKTKFIVVVHIKSIYICNFLNHWTLWFIVVVVTIGATLGFFCIVFCASFGFKLVKITWGVKFIFLEPKLTPLAQT